MIPVNPGNILPFYTDKDMQRHRQHGSDQQPFGLLASRTQLIPWQLRGQSGFVSSITVSLVNALDESMVTVITPDLEYIYQLGGGWWITYKGATISDTVDDCGYYYLKVEAGFFGTFYSDVMQVINLQSKGEEGKLEWWSETDKAEVLYQTGYKQHVWFQPNPVWGIPEIKDSPEELRNGFGKLVDTFAITEERLQFDVASIPDYALHTLTGVGYNDNVKVSASMNGILKYELTIEEVRFQHRKEGIALNTGTFSCIGRREIFTACQPNFQQD